MHRFRGFTHRSRQSIHNLKKFSVLLGFKCTPVVHKYLGGKILPGWANHRMRFPRFQVIPVIGIMKTGAGLTRRHCLRRSLLPIAGWRSGPVILIVLVVFFGLVAGWALIERPGCRRRCLRWCRMVICGRLVDRWLWPAASRLCAELRIAGAGSGIYGMIGRGRIAGCCVAGGAADRGGCRVVHGSRRAGVAGVGGIGRVAAIVWIAVDIRIDVAVWIACIAGIACVARVAVVVRNCVVARSGGTVRIAGVVRIGGVATIVGGMIVIEIGIAIECGVAAIGGRCTGIGV
jgi:hypothetical protein